MLLVSQQIQSFSSQEQRVTRPATCYYKQLNVSTTANPRELKKAYYKLAKKYHPDALKAEQKEKEEQLKTEDVKSQKAAEKAQEKDLEKREKMFKQITEAYSVLGDLTLRKKYDRLIFGTS